MDESRPVEAGARHKVLRMTFLSEFLHTGRTIVVTTGIQNVSYASVETLFFLLPHPTLYPSFTKHQWNTKFLWHATQIRAFFAKKVARGYSYSGAIVNLIRRDWWGEKTTTQQAKLLHSHVFFGGGGLRVGTGAMGLETRGYRVVRWFFKKNNRPPNLSTGTALESWRGAALCRHGHRHLQQPVVLTLAGRAVAVLWASLDEFHAHFVLLELHQKPVAHRNIIKNQPGGGDGLRPFDRNKLHQLFFFDLTRLRCRRWSAPCLRPWPRCGGVWWWSQSDVRCWVRSLLWWLRPNPEAK